MNAVAPNKVLHIASGDLWAGAEVQLFTLAKTLHNNKMISVSVVLLNHGTLEQRLQEIGIPVVVLDESKLNGIQIFFLLRRIIREKKPDIVHTHRTKENILGSIAAFLSDKTPSLRTVHGAPKYRPSWRQLPKRLITNLDWFCGRYLQHKIVAVSDDLATILKKDFPSNRICVIENGIDLEYVRKHKIKSHTKQKTIESTFKIGLAGRLVPIKRVDIFIKTARYILDHYPDLKVSFHIFGDGPVRSELEQLSHSLNLKHIVNFEGHCNDINIKLQELDTLLLTSDHEGLPMILLEAMAFEILIIAHAVGGIPRLLDQGDCGVLVREQSATSYASEIYNLFNDIGKQLKMTQNGLARINILYTAKLNEKAYFKEYSKIW